MQEDIERFIMRGQASGWQPATVANYRYHLTEALTFFSRRGCRRFADVGRGDLEALMAHVLARGTAKSTRIRMAVLLGRFFGDLREQGRILINPAKGVPLPDDGEEDLPSPPLAEAEVAAIIDSLPRASAVDLRAVCLLELLYGCGLRISEAMALNLENLDLYRRTVQILDSKHGQSRVVPLPKTAKAALQAYLSLRQTLVIGPDRGALFLTHQGTRMKRGTVYKLFGRLNQQGLGSGRHLHPHIFRHSIAVHLLRGGADIRSIQQFLGHAHLDTTKIYLRLVPGHLKEDYDAAMPEVEVGL